MTWVKLDKRAVHHTKLRRAGPVAGFLWIAGLSHCNDAGTNGRIDKRDLHALYISEHFSKRAARLAGERLVEVGLWEDCGDHWLVHDYADYQAPALRDAVEERRQKDAARKRAKRAEERGREEPKVAQEVLKKCSETNQNNVKNAPVPNNIVHLRGMSAADSARRPPPSDPDLRSAPSEQGADAPPTPSVTKAKRTRKLTALDETRLRLVALFNALYEPRYGGRSEPTSVSGCMAAVKAHHREQDGTCDEETAIASMRAYLDDPYWRTRNGYSFDGWVRSYAGSLSKARPRVAANTNQVTYDF